jgi:hypothetical protein
VAATVGHPEGFVVWGGRPRRDADDPSPPGSGGYLPASSYANLVVVKRAAFIAVRLSLATACAALFHKPRPDLELSTEDRPWRVRCGWELPSAGEPGVRPGPRADGWAWAIDSDQRRLIVTGRLEEGFFRVEAARPPRTKTIATSSRCPQRRAR